MPAPMPLLHLSLAAANLAVCHYDAAALTEADRARLEKTPTLAHNPNWQASRVLKAAARDRHSPLLCLSHRQGHAACLDSHHLVAAGVDVECMTPRDWARLCPLFCTPQEIIWLARRHYQTDEAYALWTLKEALIKAENLSFPADMRRVGLRQDGTDHTTLFSPRTDAWAGISLLVDDTWLVSAVWRSATPTISMNIHLHTEYWQPDNIRTHARWGADKAARVF